MSLVKESFLLAVMLIAIGDATGAEVPDSYEMEGTIEQRYLRHDGEWGLMSNWFEVSVSGCRSAVRTGGMDDKSIDYFEYVADGTNSELVIKYYPPEVREIAGVRHGSHARPINQANVTINSGLAPEYGFGLITPVWLACASSCFFQKAASPIEPLFSTDPGLREYHLKVKASWSLSAENPRLPQWMCDFTDGNVYKEEENGILQMDPLPKPFDKPTTNAIFAVLSWTRLGDARLPSKWQVIHYKPNRTNQTLEVRMVDTGYTTSVSSGTSRTSFKIQAPEYSRIVDRTLEAQGVPVHAYAYISTNGDILPLSEIEKEPGFAPLLKEGVKRVQPPKER